MQIEVEHVVKFQLLEIRNKLKRQNRGATWEQVFHYLLKTEANSVKLDSKVESLSYQLRLQKEAFAEERTLLQQERLEATEKFLTLSLSRPAPQTMMMAQANPTTLVQGNSPPPPPPQLTPPGRPKKKYKAPNTGDLRRDYVIEVQSVFTGVPRKPSEILLLTNPKHAEKDIVEIGKDFKIPLIEKISSLDADAEEKALEMKV